MAACLTGKPLQMCGVSQHTVDGQNIVLVGCLSHYSKVSSMPTVSRWFLPCPSQAAISAQWPSDLPSTWCTPSGVACGLPYFLRSVGRASFGSKKPARQSTGSYAKFLVLDEYLSLEFAGNNSSQTLHVRNLHRIDPPSNDGIGYLHGY